jgi:hypothetical protein
MPLRQIVTSSPETLSDMLLAADDRYEDAEELLSQMRFDGCVYLLGFSAEMWLKAVCLRLRGVRPYDPVMASLGPLKKAAKQLAPTLAFSNYHDLSFYVGCIEVLRSHVRRPLDPNLQHELRVRIINGLYNERIVDMRYRRTALTAAQAWSALENVWWIKSNWLQLV